MDLTADQLKGILDSAIVAISRFRCFPDQRREILYWSAGAEYLLGFTAAELMSDEQLWSSRIPAEDWQEKILPLFQPITSQPITRFEYRFRHRDGSLRWIAATQTVQPDPTGDSWLVTVVGHDITTHKQLEAELADRETQLRCRERQLIEAQRVAGVGSWEFELGSQKISWSEGLFRIFGLDPDQPEPDYATYLQLLHPDDVDLLQQSINRAIQTGIPYTIELRHFHPDGSCRYQEGRGEPVFDAEGRVIRLIGTAMDITDRKWAEAKIRQSEEQLRLSLEFTGIGAWSWHPDTGEYFWTGQMAELLELPPDLENMYQIWRDRIHPADVDRIETSLQRSLATGGLFADEYRYFLRDGRMVWRSVKGQGIYTETGDLERVLGVVQDISDFKRVENILQESEAQYRRIVETANEGIWIIDEENRTSFVNPKMAEILGYCVDEMIGKSLFEFMDEAEVSIAKQNIQYRRAGKSEQHDFKFQHKNGTEIWVLIATSPILDEAGQYMGALGMMTDITHRKIAELALQESETRLRLALEVSNAIAWERDLQTDQILFTSTTTLLHPHSMSYAEAMIAIHPEDRERLQQANQAAIEGGTFQLEHRLAAPGQMPEWRWIQVSARVLTDNLGNPTQMVGMSVDITDRKIAEAALQEKQQQLTSLLNNIPHIAWLKDQEGRFLAVNEPFAQACGYAASQIVGLTDCDIWSPELAEAYRRDDREVMASRQQKCVEEPLLTATGIKQWIETIKTPILNEQGEPIGTAGIALDITERKRIERALQQLNEELEQRVQQRTQALARSEQDLRTIFNNVYDAIFIHDLDGTVLDVNDRAIDLFAAPRDQLLGLQVSDLCASDFPADVFTSNLQRVQAGETLQFEAQGRRLDNYTTFDTETSVRLVSLSDRPVLLSGVRDISDRKRAERALQESERRYATLAAAAPTAIFRFDQPFNCTYVNQRWSEITGRPLESALGRGWLDTAHPEDREFLSQVYAEEFVQMASGQKVLSTGEGRMLRPDGSVVWFYAQVAPEIDCDGSVVGYIGTLTDITARKQAEAELAESEAKFRRLVEGANDLIWAGDLEGRFTYLSPQFKTLFGWEPSEWIGQSFIDLIHPDDCSLIEADHWHEGKPNQKRCQREFRHRHRQGHYLWVTTSATPILDAKGTFIGFQGILSDISDRKVAEAELRASQARLRATFEQAAVGIVQVSLEGRFIQTNQKFCEIIGYSESELLAKTYADITYAADLEISHEQIKRLLGGEHSNFMLEKRCVRKDGELVWVNLSVSLVHDAAGQPDYLIAVIQDISERIRLEQERNQSQQKLQAESLRLQLALETAEMGTWECCLETGEIFWSEPVEAMFGFAPGTFPGHREAFIERLYPADRDRVLAAITHTFATQIPYTIEYRIQRPDGTLRWLAAWGKVISLDSGLRMVGVAADITDRKQAEESLRLSQEQLQLAVESAGDGLWDWNVSTGAAYLSPRWLAILGYEVGDWPGHIDTWERLLHPDDRPQMLALLNTHLQDGSVPYQVEYRALAKSGEWRWVANYGKVVERDQSGQPLRMVGLMQDISDRKQTEQDLQESRNMLRLVLDTIPQRVFWKDRQSRFLGCNYAFANDYCLTIEEIVGKTDLELPWADFADLYRADDARVVQTLTPKLNYEEPTCNVWGEPIWIRTSKIPLTNSQGEVIGILGCYDDITELKLAEQQLQSERLRLELALEAADMGTWESNLDTGFWSERTEAIFGYAPGTFPGDREAFLRLIHLDDQERVFAALTHSFTTRSPYSVEYCIHRLDGQLRWVAVNGKVVETEDGTGLRIVGVALDITERKQIEVLLQQQVNREQILNHLVESIRSSLQLDTIFSTTTQAIANQLQIGRVAIAQYRPAQGGWVHVAEYRLDSSLPSILDMTISDGENPFSVRLQRLEIVQVNDTATITDPTNQPLAQIMPGSWLLIPLVVNGKLWGALTCLRGLPLSPYQTEEVALARRVADQLAIAIQQAELYETVQRNEQKYRALIETTDTGYVVLDQDGHILDANAEYVRLSGYQSLDQIRGRCAAEWVTPSDRERHAAAMAQCLAVGSVKNLEIDYITAGGVIVPTEINASLILTEQGLQVLGLCRDITDRKQAEATLRDSEERLRLALTASNQGLYDLNIQTGQAIVTPEYATMLGYDPATFEETNALWLQRLHPDDIERVTATYRAYVAGERPDYQVEFRQRTGNGQWKWILSVGKIVAWDEVGRPLRMLGTHTDIDDRKQAEADLLKSQALLVEAQQMARMGNWEFNPITQEIYWTEEEYCLFNLDPSQPEPSYAELAFLYHPEDWPILQGAMEQAIATGDPYKLILRTAPSGPEDSVRYLETIGQVERDSLGQVVRLYGTCQDITDRRLSELALQESEERFRQLAESITQVFWLANADLSELLYVSPAYEQVWGYSLASLHESPSQWFECIHPEDQERVNQTMQSIIQGGYQMEEYRIRRADGQIRWIRDRAFPVYNEAGDVYRIAGIAEDITERKQAELALAENNIILQSIIDSTPDVVFVKDLQGRTVIVNDAFADFFNRPKAELLGKADAELWPTEMVTHIQEIDSRIMALGRAETFEEPVPAPEGVRTYLTTKFPWRNSHGDVIGLIGMARDITERKQAEEQIQASLRQKELLLREIHHRIKNNLQVVSSLLMLQADTTADPHTHKVLQDSQERVAAIALVHEALYRSADLERIDLSEYVQDLLEQIFYSYQGSERGILLQLELEPVWLNLETVLPCALILNELLVNALKHGFPDQRSGQISVSLNCYEQMITLSVADDGIGLPPDLDCRQSSSLGLQLVHDLTEQLDGSLTIASAQSHPQGTCFTIRFQELFYRRRV